MNVLRACCAAVLIAAIGCKSSPVLRSPLPSAPTAAAPTPPPSAPAHAPVAFQEPLPPLAPGASEPFAESLSREWLAAEVVARNPTLEAMHAAWQAAQQRYPQQIALDDPVLMGMLAPQSAGSAITETAYAFQLNQKLPWFGKRNLRGLVAAADADAASHDVADTRLQVRLAADIAYFEYYLAARQLALNEQNERLMSQYRESAQIKYQNRLVTEQDVLQADLELAELARRQLELGRMHRVSAARINTLLRRWPDAPLPPPADLDSPQEPADSALLWQTALQQRPDLAALAWRVQSEEAAFALAHKNYYPDVDLFGRYDTFWQPASTQGPLRAQVGVAMNLPVYREKLRAAVCEAQFRLAQRRAEFDARAQEIQYEVTSASEQVAESHQAIALFEQRLLPAAEQNVAAARANYENSKITFLALAQAQRQLIGVREQQLEALVAYHRRLAELNRAVGLSDVH